MRSLRILFLAMSGVRVEDPELLALGLTLPGFVERSEVIASLPSLGLLTLAARCPPHWHIAYRECDQQPPDTIVEEIVKDGFQVVAISSLTARILDAYGIADGLRRSGVQVILGGLHASAMPDEAAMHADAVVIGEGETCWNDIVSDLESGRLSQRYVSPRGGSSHFHSAPPPRYDLLDPARYNRLTLQTTRGCPLACNFCAASRLISPYRRKSIPQVRRELDAIRAVWKHPFIELADDNTFLDKSWSRELVKTLGEAGVRWFTETDISIADDETLLDELAASGCAQLLIGLESARPRSLQGLDARDWKRRQFDRYAEKVARIQSRGISVNGCFILGFDTDDESIFAETLDFADTLELAEVQITLLTAFPGTELHRRLAAEGRLPRDPYWNRCTLFDLTFEPRGMSASSLRNGFRWLMQEIYSAERVRQRKRRFRDCVRAARSSSPP